ncbi:MAG TPA: hypothetical protein VIY48_00060 [Candidatus Paceibacterota bacterium]
MVKMVPEVKALLLDALKSGEYQKTTGLLKRHNDDDTVGYCCLGVLSDVANKQGVCGEWKRATDGAGYPQHWYDMPEEVNDGFETYVSNNTAFLPKSVAEWSGLDDAVQTVLANINDESTDFAPVIEHIEINL